jgi:hypothetical protein
MPKEDYLAKAEELFRSTNTPSLGGASVYEINFDAITAESIESCFEADLYVVRPLRGKTVHQRVLPYVHPKLKTVEMQEFFSSLKKPVFRVIYFYQNQQAINKKEYSPHFSFACNYLPGSNIDSYAIPCGVPVMMPLWMLHYLKSVCKNVEPTPFTLDYELKSGDPGNLEQQLQTFYSAVHFSIGKNRLTTLEVPEKHVKRLLERYCEKLNKEKLYTAKEKSLLAS